METLVLKGIITATSDKDDGKFKGGVVQKTAYLKLDEKESEKAKRFGLVEYGQDDKFFIVKLSKEITLRDGNNVIKRSGIANETPNFSSGEKKVAIAIVKTVNEKYGKEFFRLYSIYGTILNNTAQDPFKDMELEDIDANLDDVLTDLGDDVSPKLDIHDDEDITF